MMSMMSICTQVIEQRYECDKTDLDKSMESVIATVQAENKKKKDELYLDKDLALQLEKLVKETKDQKTKRQRTMLDLSKKAGDKIDEMQNALQDFENAMGKIQQLLGGE